MTVQRSRDAAKAGHQPGAASALFKVYATELNKRRTELMVKIAGPAGLGWEGPGFDEEELAQLTDSIREHGLPADAPANDPVLGSMATPSQRALVKYFWVVAALILVQILLGIVVYHLTGNYRTWADLSSQSLGDFLLKTFKRGPFETLTHIGVTSLWVLPVIASAGWVRVLFAIACGGLHIWLSQVWYYEWNLMDPRGIDGGPLGFLTWTIPLIVGSLAYDWMMRPRKDKSDSPMTNLLAGGMLLMIVAYALSCLNRWTAPNIGTVTGDWWIDQLAAPPFVAISEPWKLNYWVMSQRAGSITYLLFGAGFGLAVLALFRWLCDHRGWRWGYLDLLGRHALAGYIIHSMVEGAVKPFVPKDAPGWYVVLAIGVYLGIVTLFLRHLDRNRLFLKL